MTIFFERIIKAAGSSSFFKQKVASKRFVTAVNPRTKVRGFTFSPLRPHKNKQDGGKLFPPSCHIQFLLIDARFSGSEHLTDIAFARIKVERKGLVNTVFREIKADVILAHKFSKINLVILVLEEIL